MKIRKGDSVIVISGKRENKGKTAKVLKVFPVTNKVLVEGINVVTKHVKKQGTQAGQIFKMEKPIDVSNVMLECPMTQKPTRLGHVFVTEKGVTKKFRYSKMAAKMNKKDPKDCIIK